MKKLLVVALVLALTLGMASGALAQTVLKLAEVHVETYPTGLADAEFARLVEEKTEGRIKIELYFNGTLYASEKDSIEALQLGELAFSRVSASPVSNFVPSINAIQMPYLYKNAAHMWAVLNGEIGQGILAGIEASPDAGLIGLCYYDAGSRCFYLTREVHSVADMAGLKIRVQDNSMMKRMVELLGATPVTGIGPNEVYTAISSGVVDGAENNWPTYESKKDYEVAKYYIFDQHTRVPEIMLASKAALAVVSAEDMQIIRECAVAVQQYEIDEWAKREVLAQDIVKAAGTVVIELTPEAFAEFQAKMAPLYDEFGANYVDYINAIKAVGEGF
jgi:tripartite ATP-independent transporter DctP family solute receptor